ncbi:MAG TPA: HEAT repeat domain-containing protein [Thermoanaerobaculia bacterium]|nr:HEAT repeat domain-containing protein [Thermoanaerobaculia bacterium]
MWEAVLIVLGGGAALGFSALGGRKRLRAWQDAVVSCGLQVVETSSAWYPWLKARTGLMELRISTSGDKRTQIVVKAPWPPELQWVSIRPESAVQPAEIEIGDRRFDGIFFIGGSPNLVFALLDAETRRLLFHLSLDGKLDISRGELRLVQMSDENVPHALPLLLDIGRRFAQPMDIPLRLAANAQDPIRGVRLQNLRLLIREFPDDPATAEALRKACSDPRPEIRLLAAREVGAEGRGIFLELAESLEDDAVSAEAVSTLGRELPFERTKTILDRALSRRCVRTARACLEAIGRGGDAAAVDILAKVLENEYGELAPTAAWALGAIGSPAAEPPLIAALQRDQSDLRVVAANALGRVGSVAAVLPLKEMADRLLVGEIRRAARQAIAEIQSRVQGASPGQLSLAGAEAGQLSLAQADAGQLSLATDPAGQLSISGDNPDAAPGTAASPGADERTS